MRNRRASFRMAGGLALGVVAAAQPASAIDCREWLRPRSTRRRMATIDGMIGDLVGASGKVRQYDVHRGAIGRCLSEQRLSDVADDFDDVCSDSRSADMQAIQTGVQELRLELQLACARRCAAAGERSGSCCCSAARRVRILRSRSLPRRPSLRADSWATTARSGPAQEARRGSSFWTRSVDFSGYERVIIEPVVVWQSSEARFAGVAQSAARGART